MWRECHLAMGSWDPNRQDAQRWLYLQTPQKHMRFWNSKHTPGGYGADVLVWVRMRGSPSRKSVMVLALDSTPSISTPVQNGAMA